MKAGDVVSVVPIVLRNAQALTGDFKALSTAFVMLKDMTDIRLISAFDKSGHQLTNRRSPIELPFCFCSTRMP
jgi:hypothetical protein